MITRVKGSTIQELDLFGAVSTYDMGPKNTDITAAINAALAAGLPVCIGIGTWYITGISIPANGIVFGFGANSILKLKDTTNAIGVVAGSNCDLQNFVVDGNKVNQVGGNNFHCFDFTNATDTTCSRVAAVNPKGCGFYVAGAANEIQLHNCSATGFMDSGFKVVAGSNINITNPKVFSSDAAATGDGIALISNGAAINNVIVSNPVIKNVSGRGVALIGNGARNVTDVAISNPRITSPTNHAIHMLNVDGATVIGGLSKSSGADGVRLEGDVQNCRVSMHISKSHVGFGMREIVNGTTPNTNGFIYNNLATNGNNAVTKVGAASYIV